MGGIDFTEFLYRLKSRTNIVDVVSSYVQLTRKGSNYWGNCPFHNEKTPSFSVNEERQFYKCFGCNVSGDVITFVQNIEKLEFMEAVRKLAERVGMEIPSFEDTDKLGERRRKRKENLEMMKSAAMIYHENLMGGSGKKARDYLSGRLLSADTATAFGMGYSTDYDTLIKKLAAKGYAASDMKECGLAEEKNGKVYDALAGRLIVPIINNLGEVVAFGGRVLEDSGFAKYKNTKETPHFEKRKLLFALNMVKKHSVNNPVDSIIVVEGYMDVIQLYQAGIRNVVASMGTALTEEHAELLRRYVKKAYLCYDGDSAGQRATYKGGDILAGAGLDVRVLRLTDNLDPDDYIKKYGKNGFLKLTESAVSVTEYKLRRLAEEYDTKDIEGRRAYAIEAVKIVKQLPDIVGQEAYLPLIGKLSSLTEDAIKRQLYNTERTVKEHMRTSSTPPAPMEKKLSAKYYKAMRAIFYAYLTGNIQSIDEFYSVLEDDEHIAIYNKLKEKQGLRESIELKTLEELHDNTEARTILKTDYGVMDAEELKEYLKDCVNSFRKDLLMREKRELSLQLEKADGREERGEILKQLAALTESLKQYKE